MQHFQTKMLAENNIVVLKCYAEWCAPCKMMTPIFEKLVPDFENVTFAQLNVEEEAEFASSYSVTSVPTTLIFKDGLLQKTLVGAVPGIALKVAIKDVIGE